MMYIKVIATAENQRSIFVYDEKILNRLSEIPVQFRLPWAAERATLPAVAIFWVHRVAALETRRARQDREDIVKSS